jgi:hypothetical protein
MKRLVPTALAAVLITTSGCHMFSKKTVAPPKEGPDISNQVEKDFEQRWLDHRTAELVAQGTAPAAAHEQAINEFRDKFSYTKAAQDLGAPAH